MTPPIRPSVFFEGSESSSLARRQSGRIDEKMLACFHLAGHHHFGNAFLLEDFDELAKLPQRDPMAARGKRFHFLGGFLFDGDDDHNRAPGSARFGAPAAGTARFRQ